jgi:hypothetical protein
MSEMAKSRGMARCPNASPARVSAAWQALSKALFDGYRPYRPERHYMRGPGPKWHEKHEIEGVSPVVRKALMAGLQP